MKCLPLKYSETHAYGNSREGECEHRCFVTLTNIVLLQNSAPLGPAGQAIPVYMKYVSMVIRKPVLRCGEKKYMKLAFPMEKKKKEQERKLEVIGKSRNSQGQAC